MSDDIPIPDASSADVHGLPVRSESGGRDRLEVIASEYLARTRAGERLDIDTFAGRYPQLTNEIREFLPLVAAMEDWKAHRELQSIHQPLPDRFEIDELGEFRIIQEIARGGMGVVFEAEQPSLNRRVAVKLLPWRFPKKSSWAEQFVREARIAASLQHANIVPIFSFGEQSDRYFYVMQLVEGVGLDKLISCWKRDAGLVSIEQLVQEFRPSLVGNRAFDDQKRTNRILRQDSWQQLGKIAAQIISAIRYAHKQKTLHRDIKPANLLIDLQGKVWITDFGLAVGREKLLSDASEPLAGTLRYMAPEQFQEAGDERSDLYSFGVTLYELCTLQPAFEAKTQRDLIRAIQSGEAPAPRSINRDIPDELERIIQKAMCHDSNRRYQSADELHADLLGFLNGTYRRRSGGWRRLLRKWF